MIGGADVMATHSHDGHEVPAMHLFQHSIRQHDHDKANREHTRAANNLHRNSFQDVFACCSESAFFDGQLVACQARRRLR